MSSTEEQIAKVQTDFNAQVEAIRKQAGVSAAAKLQSSCKHACVFCGKDVSGDHESRIAALEAKSG